MPIDQAVKRSAGTIRLATFNVSLAGDREGQMISRLKEGGDPQALALAAIIQQVDPDVLVLNEIDYDARGELMALFEERYLGSARAPEGPGPTLKPVRFPHRYSAAVNTGVASEFDLDRDGVSGAKPGSSEYARDAWGFGRYPGQYGMAVFSKFPLQAEKIRTFAKFRWKDMPGALLPAQAGGEPWYGPEVLEHFPLSSKSHWDVPVSVPGATLHLLVSHPTPPVFDGPEDRNGRRNHDEIRLWADYVSDKPEASAYLVDDQERRGGLEADALFAVLGDLNSDPADGSDSRFPIRQLLNHPRVQATFVPSSLGGSEQAMLQKGFNEKHRGNAAEDTSDFADDDGPGNMRLDYVLPSRGLKVAGGGVFWPTTADPSFDQVGKGHPIVSSDHRLVWLDVVVQTKK